MNYRHGDLALIKINQLPEGLQISNNKTLLIGSHNNAHSYNVGEFYPIDEEIILGYFVAIKGTELYHKDHGVKINNKKLRIANIEPDIYELRKQQENTHEGMKPVID
jgi:hypothetical protein